MPGTLIPETPPFVDGLLYSFLDPTWVVKPPLFVFIMICTPLRPGTIPFQLLFVPVLQDGILDLRDCVVQNVFLWDVDLLFLFPTDDPVDTGFGTSPIPTFTICRRAIC